MPDHPNKQCAIVFGGAGFIGTRLLSELCAGKLYDRVIAYDIKAPERPVDGVEYITGDVREPILLDPGIVSPEIYNLAAVHKTPGHPDWEYFWTNVLGATNVCNYAAEANAKFLLFTSSISVYGPSEVPVTEGTPPCPNSAYGRSKLQAEGIHRTWQKSGSDRRLVIVRPAVVFGSGEKGNFTRLAYLLSKRLFVYAGRRDTIKSCCYVDEVVRTFAFARALGRAEFTYNCSYPDRTTIEDICNAFSETAGFTRPRLTIPLQVLHAGTAAFRLLSALGVRTAVNNDRIAKLVHSTNILPDALAKAGYVYDGGLKQGLNRWRDDSAGAFV